VFCSVLGLTLLSLVASIYLGTREPLPHAGIQALDAFLTTWKMGFGTIAGLLAAGKALP